MSEIKRLTRIKYLKDEQGVYTSHKEFLANDGILVNVQINTTNNTVSVLQVTGSGMYSVVETTAYSKFTEAKKIGKALLKKYGVIFFEETRKKKVVKEAS
jgi:hypothetical protein